MSNPIPIPTKVISALRQARNVAVLTGAGISAESGIPTFREAQTGLWEQYNPEELATPQAFKANSELVWRWYQWRQKIVKQAQPNPGHYALAKLEAKLAKSEAIFTLITQNVDGLHQRAGSHKIIELHGNINRSKCEICHQNTESASLIAIEIPRCAQCGGLLRPDVVWFGESLPQDALRAANAAAQSCDLFFSIGTSSLVQPAASLPIVALQNGAVVIEINPNPTQISILVAHTLQGPSGEVLPDLINATWPDLR